MTLHANTIPRLLLAICAAASFSDAAQACSTRDGCISAIMGAARAGDQVATFQLTTKLQRLAQQPPASQPAADGARFGPADVPYGNVDDTLIATLEAGRSISEFAPEFRRMLALAYMTADRPHDAERYLRESLAALPAHAQLWGELATAFTMQGKTGDAVSALTVAYAYAADQPKARKLYEQAAAISPLKAMRPVYSEALAAVDAGNAAALAALPPLPATDENKKENATRPKQDKMAMVKFDECDKPEWPKHSLRFEQTGTVTIAFFTDENGKLKGMRKVGSSGHIALDLAAMTGVSVCAFNPAIIDGKPTASWAKMQYVWTLE